MNDKYVIIDECDEGSQGRIKGQPIDSERVCSDRKYGICHFCTNNCKVRIAKK